MLGFAICCPRYVQTWYLTYRFAICKFEQSAPASQLDCACSTRHIRTATTPAAHRCSRCSGETCSPAAPAPGPPLSACRDGAKGSSLECPTPPESPQPPAHSDVRTATTA